MGGRRKVTDVTRCNIPICSLRVWLVCTRLKEYATRSVAIRLLLYDILSLVFFNTLMSSVTYPSMATLAIAESVTDDSCQIRT